MQLIPLSDEISKYVAGLTAVPTRTPPRAEPPFLPVGGVMSRLVPPPGEVVVVVGMVPTVRMLIGAIVVNLVNHATRQTVIDAGGYACPSMYDLIAALSGVPMDGIRAELDRVLGAADVLQRMNVAMVSSEHALTRLPTDAGLIVIEGERFDGGVAGIAREAATTGKAAIVPHDECDDLPIGAWRTVRLRGDGPAFPGGHFHVLATFEGSGETVRLAQGAGGRFL